jgi:hypothetical protein
VIHYRTNTEKENMKQEIVTINGQEYLVPSDEAIISIRRHKAANEPHVKQYEDPSIEEMQHILLQAETHTDPESFHTQVTFTKVYADAEQEKLAQEILNLEENHGVYAYVSSERVYHNNPEKLAEMRQAEKDLETTFNIIK